MQECKPFFRLTMNMLLLRLEKYVHKFNRISNTCWR